MGAGHAHVLYIHEHTAIHHLAPEAKVAAAVLFTISVALTPPRAVIAFGFYGVAVLTVAVMARIPLRFLAIRLAAILPFILFAFFIPFIGTGERVDFLWFTVSVDGLWAAWGIIAKASIGAMASIVLVATTEAPAILRGLGRLKVPALIVAIAGFMIRYLELVVEEMKRMRQAMTSRGYQPRWIGQARPIAVAAGALFVRSYERGERVHSAMVSRGYTGTMPELGAPGASPGEWARAMIVPLAAAGVATTAMVLT